MEIAEFKVRCYICWKQFLIPTLSDFSYGEFLFVDYKTREFRYLNRIENKEVESILVMTINSDFSLNSKNNDLTADQALKVIGKLSDGEFEPIFSYVKCPRCKIGFYTFPNVKNGMIHVEELSFEDIKRTIE